MSVNIVPNQGQPELTVVVIAYNNELYIEEALESLDEQTFQNMEVVVVNDCSTDRTGEIIDKFIINKPKFKAIHLKENSGGCSVPRNTGIANSSGKYLMFLDGDDWYTVDACEQMVSAIKRTNSDFVSGQVIRTNTYEIWYHNRIFSKERININIREFTELIFDSLSVNKIYKRSFLDKNNLRFPEGLQYEDVLFTGKAYFLADSVSIIPKPIYYWRVVEDAEVKSITNQRSEISNLKHRLISHSILDNFLIETGNSIYLAQKNNKFLRHDLKLYINDYFQFDDEYKKEFHKLIYDYMHQHINKYELFKLYEELRIQCFLLYIGDTDAFKDYMLYLNGMPTSQNRVNHNGEFYFFKSDKIDEDDQKFLRMSRPSINFEIRNYKIENGLLTFQSKVDLPSIKNEEYTYTWLLINYNTKEVIHSTLQNNEFKIELENSDAGNYFLTLYVNHLGTTLVEKVRSTDVKFFNNSKVKSRKMFIATYINKNNLVGVTIEPIKNTDYLKWMIQNRRAKEKDKKQPSPIRSKLEGIIKSIIRKLPIKSKWIVLESHMGKQYSDSPKYIYEELINSRKDFKFIWSLEDPDIIDIPGPAVKVKRNSLKHYYYLSRSKYWVDNQGIAHLTAKRKGQVYLQTWHGTPLKKMGYDQYQTNPNQMKRLKLQTNAWDYFISPNTYSTEIFRRAFLYSGKILETGYPRNDVLINKPASKVNKVKEYFNISPEKKVILYAPTFRDWDEKSYHDTLRDIQILSRQVDKNTIVLLRLHYLLASKVSKMLLPNHIIDTSNYADIQELYLISDVLITDYSSVMFDFSLLRRPIILYCYDLEKYYYYRGTYFDIVKCSPGPVCRTIDEVSTYLKDPEKLSEYNTLLDQFSERFGNLEDGMATQKVIDEVFN